MSTKRYSDTVWRSIRELWEVSPTKTTMTSILDMVRDKLDCDVPSSPAVLKRKNKEKWKKLSQKELKTRVKKEVKPLSEINLDDAPQNDEPQEFEPVDETQVKNGKLVKSGEAGIQPEPLPPSIEVLVKGAASKKVARIVALRNQALNIFNITQNGINGLVELMAELELIDHESVDEQKLAALSWQLSMFERVANVSDTYSKVNERTTKMTIGLYGYEPEDFKDHEEIASQRSEKMANLDAILEEKQRIMREQQTKAFMRDLAQVEDMMRNG